MKILIDMNLPPIWVSVLEQSGFEAVHWSDVGSPDAPDHEIFGYAKTQGFVIFTHDLDFGSILAATHADYPSVIQIRTQDVTPDNIENLVISAVVAFQHHLETGALITIDEKKRRARVLPITH